MSRLSDAIDDLVFRMLLIGDFNDPDLIGGAIGGAIKDHFHRTGKITERQYQIAYPRLVFEQIPIETGPFFLEPFKSACELEMENAMRHGRLVYFDDDSRLGCFRWMGLFYYAEIDA